MKPNIYPLLALLLASALIFSCSGTDKPEEVNGKEPQVVVKRRSDGTISSVNQVDDHNQVHGTRVTYYRDGKTVYSKQSFRHGKKHGPAIWYYENGQVFEEASFELGERHGPHRKYHKSGELLAEYAYEKGHALPGLKEYAKDGTLVTEYPEIGFRERDHLAFRNRIDLEVICSRSQGKMKFHRVTRADGKVERTYLITEKGRALMQFYVPPGETLDEKVEILAEIPTDMGNILVLERSYRLRAANKK